MRTTTLKKWNEKTYKNETFSIASNNRDRFVYTENYFIINQEDRTQDKLIDKTVKLPKVKKQKIAKRKRRRVWDRYFPGSLKGECCCCFVELDYEGWHCGHIIADANGGTTDEDNLRVTCPICNWEMGTINMKDYVREHYPLAYEKYFTE